MLSTCITPKEVFEMDEIKIETAEAEVTEETAVVEEPKTEAQLLREAEEAEKARKAKWNNFWDKITTGILIFLMASPLLILGYIFWWFTVGA